MQKHFKLIPTVYLLLRRDDEILFLLRANTGYQDGKYGLIAGHLDGNELAKDGMIREAKEEADIIIDNEKLEFVHLAHRLNRNEVGQERLDIFFECKEWEGEIINMEPNKCDELAWYSANDHPNETLPLIKRVINDVSAGKSYSEYTLEPK